MNQVSFHAVLPDNKVVVLYYVLQNSQSQESQAEAQTWNTEQRLQSRARHDIQANNQPTKQFFCTSTTSHLPWHWQGWIETSFPCLCGASTLSSSLSPLAKEKNIFSLQSFILTTTKIKNVCSRSIHLTSANHKHEWTNKGET